MHSVPVTFTGKAFEYFKIWVPNTLLTIVTLGFYGPLGEGPKHAVSLWPHADRWPFVRVYRAPMGHL